MVDQRQLEVIDKLYKSILAPDTWSHVLEEVTDDIGAYGLNLFVGDKVIGELNNTWFTKSLEPGALEYMKRGYFKYEAPISETIGLICQQPDLIHMTEVQTEHNKLSENKIDLEFLNGWLHKEYGVANRYMSPLNYHASHFDTLCVSMSEQANALDSQVISRCNFYLPHIANLVNYARPFLLLQSRFKAVLEVLDRYRLGVFLLSDNAQVVEYNQAAKDIITQRDGLNLDVKNRIQASDSQSDDKLKTAIALATRSSEQKAQSNHEKLTVMRPSLKTDWLLDVSPLLHNELPIGAVVIVIDPEQRSMVDTSHFQELFGLTAAEQHICQLLSEGHNANGISEIRDTGKETVRGQIKSVLEKTGTHKQSELVRLAVSINIPVDDNS